MRKLSEAQLKRLIQARQPVDCQIRGSELQVRISEYTPLVCTTLRAGTLLSEELTQRLRISPEQRFALEHAGTEKLTELLPITLTAHESRLGCSLHSQVANSLRQRLEGQQLWQKPPTKAMHSRAQRLHRQFYNLLDTLLEVLNEDFGHCLLVDLNLRNGDSKSSPVFEVLGHAPQQPELLASTEAVLEQAELPHLESLCQSGEASARNNLHSHLQRHHPQTHMLTLKVAPVFIDAQHGLYPVMADAISRSLHDSLYAGAAALATQSNSEEVSALDLMPRQLPKEVIQVDKALKKLARGLETLLYINPTNLAREEKQFMRNPGRYQPQFRYRQLRIDPFLHREKLYRLPVDDIRDPSLRQLYRDVIDTLAERIDLLVSIGTDRFQYNSLRYYGEPTADDLANARFLLHAADRIEETEAERYPADQMTSFFSDKAKAWGLECKVELSDRILAQAMVSSGRKALMVKRDTLATESEMHALAHHELGVHMVTSLNAAAQPLKVFSLGMPGNTHAQEGLAILSEYLCGHLTLKRLKTLALRVVAVDQMLRYGDFCRTWRMLVEDHGCSHKEAFKITARIHRGGGFTKDHLYLSGFREALNLWRQGDISALYIGKTGFSYLSLLEDLLSRGLIEAPLHLPDSFKHPVTSPPEIAYLVSCIR